MLTSQLNKSRRLNLHSKAGANLDGLVTVLQAQDGVVDVKWQNTNRLSLTYDLSKCTLEELVSLIPATEFDTTPTLSATWYLRWVIHLETMQLESDQVNNNWQSYLRDVYIDAWQRHRHGRIDYRPRHWHDYLERDQKDG